MTSVLNTALAGMARDLRGLDTAANNVANVNTDGYRARREAPALDSTATDSDLPASDVDLATEFVHLKLHEIGYQANGVLIRVADRLMQTTLDLLA